MGGDFKRFRAWYLGLSLFACASLAAKVQPTLNDYIHKGTLTHRPKPNYGFKRRFKERAEDTLRNSFGVDLSTMTAADALRIAGQTPTLSSTHPGLLVDYIPSDSVNPADTGIGPTGRTVIYGTEEKLKSDAAYLKKLEASLKNGQGLKVAVKGLFVAAVGGQKEASKIIQDARSAKPGQVDVIVDLSQSDHLNNAAQRIRKEIQKGVDKGAQVAASKALSSGHADIVNRALSGGRVPARASEAISMYDSTVTSKFQEGMVMATQMLKEFLDKHVGELVTKDRAEAAKKAPGTVPERRYAFVLTPQTSQANHELARCRR